MLGLVAAACSDPAGRGLLGAGLCGGLTTFSTLQLELYDLFDAGEPALAAAYAAVSVAAGLIAIRLGERLGAGVSVLVWAGIGALGAVGAVLRVLGTQLVASRLRGSLPPARSRSTSSAPSPSACWWRSTRATTCCGCSARACSARSRRSRRGCWSGHALGAGRRRDAAALLVGSLLLGLAAVSLGRAIA